MEKGHSWRDATSGGYIHLIEHPLGSRAWIVYKVQDGYKIRFMNEKGEWQSTLHKLSTRPEVALGIANQHLGPSLQQEKDEPPTPELAEYDLFDQED